MEENSINEEFTINLDSTEDITTPTMTEERSYVGLSIEDVKALIAKENKAVVDDNDPILIVLTMLNAALFEQDKLQQKHRAALTKMLGEVTDNYIQAVQGSVDGLTNALSQASEKGIQKSFLEHKAELSKHKSALNLSTALNFVSAIVLVGTLIVLTVSK